MICSDPSGHVTLTSIQPEVVFVCQYCQYCSVSYQYNDFFFLAEVCKARVYYTLGYTVVEEKAKLRLKKLHI